MESWKTVRAQGNCGKTEIHEVQNMRGVVTAPKPSKNKQTRKGTVGTVRSKHTHTLHLCSAWDNYVRTQLEPQIIHWNQSLVNPKG